MADFDRLNLAWSWWSCCYDRMCVPCVDLSHWSEYRYNLGILMFSSLPTAFAFHACKGFLSSFWLIPSNGQLSVFPTRDIGLRQEGSAHDRIQEPPRAARRTYNEVLLFHFIPHLFQRPLRLVTRSQSAKVNLALGDRESTPLYI